MGCLDFCAGGVRIVPGSLSEGVSFVERNPPFVGAMKIARNPGH